MSAILADRLQVWGFEKDLILFSDGSLGFGLELSPLDVSCWSEDRINDITGRIIQFLNGLSPGLDLQFIQEISGGNDSVIGAHTALCSDSATETARTLTDTRVQRLKEFDAQGLIPRHTLKLFVRQPLSRPLLEKPKLFSKTVLFPKIAEHELERELGRLERLQREIIDSFNTLQLYAKPIGADRLMDLMYWQWNPSRPIGRGHTDPENVRSSLLFTDVANDEKGFSLGDTHFRVVSLKLLPEQTYSSMATVLRELPFDSRIFLTVHVPDQQKEIEALQIQRRLAFSMARGKRNGVSDIESEAKFQDLETLLAEMIAQGEKVFHVSFNILLRSKSVDDLDTKVAQTLAKVRELSAAEAMEESLAAFEIFAELSIPNARAKERAKRMKTSTLADLLPIYGPWSGHAKPSIMLRSRMGSLVSFDPFSQDLTNYNHVISGGSGSGKSFLTNILLLQTLKESPKVFIVDIGGSYKKISDNLDGQYIPLGVNTGMSINPFDLPPGETIPDSHKIKFILGLIESMTKEEGDTRLPRLERAEIEEAIQKVYERSHKPRLSVLREILLEHQNVEIRRFGRILTPWCGDTPYGRFVDRPTTIELQRPIVSFDLKGMEAYPDLQAICLFIITDYIWREVQKDRSAKKFLVFDECWKLLENEAGSAFIAEVFRTFRKYYASAIAISQNIDDFAKSKVAGAILSNSSIKWILMQRGADQARLKEVLQLNDSEMALVASLHQERGLYSEAFLMAGDYRSVVAVESTPLEYWIATTDPRDLATFDAAQKEHQVKPPLEILLELARKYPRGVVSSAKQEPEQSQKQAA